MTDLSTGFLAWMAATDAYQGATGPRPIEKAMRTITVRAHFSHDGHGGLHPVRAYVEQVDQQTYEKTVKERVASAHAAILKLRAGKGRPPFATFKGHVSLGPIGLTYSRLEHIIQQREKRGQDVDACLKGMAEALIHGRAKAEPSGKDNRREHTPQIWLTHGDHQVTLAPFWDEKGLPTSTVPAWIVSGYQMTDDRKQEEQSAKEVVVQRTILGGEK